VFQRVPGRLRPRNFLTFSTTRVVGHQPYAPAPFTPGEIPGTHFQELSRPRCTWFCQGEPRKKFPVTVRLVAQCLNHYATPGPHKYNMCVKMQSFLMSMFFFTCFQSLRNEVTLSVPHAAISLPTKLLVFTTKQISLHLLYL